MAIVEAKHFTFTYAGAVEPTLNDVSFAIERGEVIGIIGPMGAGKTTLCMAIAGFVPRILGGQATGTLQVAGHDLRQAPRDKRHRQVGMVFDYEGQLTQLRVLDEVMMPLLHGGASKQEAEEQARRLLARVGLGSEALEGRKVWELSGGQQQRLAIAAMLALDPQVLIFDDAMNMLDPRGQEEVRRLITDLAGTKTLVVVEQDPELLQTVDRILVLVKGNVVAQGTPDEILRNHDMLARADLEPPAYLRVARALDLSESPRTPEELALALGQIDSQADAWPEAGDHFGAVLVHLEDVTYCDPDGVRALDNVHLHIRTGSPHRHWQQWCWENDLGQSPRRAAEAYGGQGRGLRQ